MPIMNPIKAKEKQVRKRKKVIMRGWAICKGTNKSEKERKSL
jgi:hypothetical protein